jgi:3',5'-cyclic AMP phosphodiesterase CpdA
MAVAAVLSIGAEPIAPPTAPAAVSSCAVETSDRIVAIGDVHGAYEAFVRILQEAKLIDGRRRWAGGRAHLVQTGDVVDRGKDSRRVMDLLRTLESDAAKAGGRVHALVGNHEAMRAYGIMRDASPGEYSAFQTPESVDLRDSAYDYLVRENTDRARKEGRKFDVNEFKKVFLANNPLGAIEMNFAFGPKGEYGRWIRGHDVMVRINGIVFLHGGLTPAAAALGCDAINAAARKELESGAPPADQERSLTTGPDGPLWYRGLADGGASAADVEAVLKAMQARALVIGHTVADDYRITSKFGGRVVQIDTGMLGSTFFPGGKPSALEIRGDEFVAIYEGRREPLVTR